MLEREVVCMDPASLASTYPSTATLDRPMQSLASTNNALAVFFRSRISSTKLKPEEYAYLEGLINGKNSAPIIGSLSANTQVPSTPFASRFAPTNVALSSFPLSSKKSLKTLDIDNNLFTQNWKTLSEEVPSSGQTNEFVPEEVKAVSPPRQMTQTARDLMASLAPEPIETSLIHEAEDRPIILEPSLEVHSILPLPLFNFDMSAYEFVPTTAKENIDLPKFSFELY